MHHFLTSPQELHLCSLILWQATTGKEGHCRTSHLTVKGSTIYIKHIVTFVYNHETLSAVSGAAFAEENVTTRQTVARL